MHALGRGFPMLALARLDAELVRLDVPARRPGRQPTEQGAAVFQDGAHAGTVAYLVGDRLEPALDAAVQTVVVERLEVRLVRAARIGPWRPANHTPKRRRRYRPPSAM